MDLRGDPRQRLRGYCDWGTTRRRTQLVKVPLSDAVWSTWRRHCGTVRLTMGEGIAGLIAHELGTLVNDDRHHGAVLAAESQRQLTARSEAPDIRERRLAEREQSLKASERLLRARTRPLDATGRANAGRNDPCPCGSGFKYKRCHWYLSELPRVNYGCFRDPPCRFWEGGGERCVWVARRVQCCVGCLSVVGVFEDFVEWDVEGSSDLEGGFEGGRESALFDGDDCLSCYVASCR